jgi:hypothetical protein
MSLRQHHEQSSLQGPNLDRMAHLTRQFHLGSFDIAGGTFRAEPRKCSLIEDESPHILTS